MNFEEDTRKMADDAARACSKVVLTLQRRTGVGQNRPVSVRMAMDEIVVLATAMEKLARCVARRFDEDTDKSEGPVT